MDVRITKTHISFYTTEGEFVVCKRDQIVSAHGSRTGGIGVITMPMINYTANYFVSLSTLDQIQSALMEEIE